MAEIALAVETERPTGSAAARRLRRSGHVPGVLYGRGVAAVHVSVDARELRSALTTEAGQNALLSIKIGAKKHLVMARELQRHPVRHTIAHVDFLVVHADEAILSEVPITLRGDAVEVAHGDGRVEQHLFDIHVRAKPADIPHGIEVDISALTIGSSIAVADLVLPEGVTTDVDPDVVIVSGQPPRVVHAEEGEEAAAEGEAPAPAAAAQGQEPAAQPAEG